eukprot:653345-Rhodomonas_salina.5
MATNCRNGLRKAVDFYAGKHRPGTRCYRVPCDETRVTYLADVIFDVDAPPPPIECNILLQLPPAPCCTPPIRYPFEHSLYIH